MNLEQTLQLMFNKGNCMKAKAKDASDASSSASDASASDISAENPSTFYGPNTDMGPAKALDPE